MDRLVYDTYGRFLFAFYFGYKADCQHAVIRIAVPRVHLFGGQENRKTMYVLAMPGGGGVLV